jgi:predicted nuclease with RNAse H fold
VLKLKGKIIIGIDLAGKEENPTGFAIWRNKTVETCLIYTDKEILEKVFSANPKIVAIDAPLNLPKSGIFRKADKELIKKGYRVFPPGLPAMKKLTLRAIELNRLITERGIQTIEVHPTSTRKALGMPTKDWEKIQNILKSVGLAGSLSEHRLTPHEIDAITAALTGYLHMEGLTESVGDHEEGYIIVPIKQDWREIRL